MKRSSPLTHEELRRRVEKEGIDPNDLSVKKPRWLPSGFKSSEAVSALVNGNVILSSDMTAIILDEEMLIDSSTLVAIHVGIGHSERSRAIIFALYPELDGIDLPTSVLTEHAIEKLGWETYISRMNEMVKDGRLNTLITAP